MDCLVFFHMDCGVSFLGSAGLTFPGSQVYQLIIMWSQVYQLIIMYRRKAGKHDTLNELSNKKKQAAFYIFPDWYGRYNSRFISFYSSTPWPWFPSTWLSSRFKVFVPTLSWKKHQNRIFPSIPIDWSWATGDRPVGAFGSAFSIHELQKRLEWS